MTCYFLHSENQAWTPNNAPQTRKFDSGMYSCRTFTAYMKHPMLTKSEESVSLMDLSIHMYTGGKCIFQKYLKVFHFQSHVF